MPVTDDSPLTGDLMTAPNMQLMFLYRHERPNTTDEEDSEDGAVRIYCKAFSKISPRMMSVFTLDYPTFSSFEKDMVETRLLVPSSRLTLLRNTLMVSSAPATTENGGGKRRVTNKTLVVTKSAIFTALTKSFVKSGTDPAKWYVLTALRTVVGGPDGPAGMTFPTIKSIVEDYHKTVSKTVNTASLGDSSTVFEVYNIIIAPHLMSHISSASEYCEAAKTVFSRLSATFTTFNSAVDAVTSNTQTFANLVFNEMLGERYESTLDVMEEENPAAEDARRLAEYKERLNTINNSGCEHIKEHLSSTCAFVPYDPEKHVGYVFDKTGPYRKSTGTTDPVKAAVLCKKIIPTNIFPNSLSKEIRVMGANTLSKLCNSSMMRLMTKTPVKDILRANGVRTNVPFLGVVKPITERAHFEGSFPRRFGYSLLEDPEALDAPFTANAPYKEISEHLKNPSTMTFNGYVAKYVTSHSRAKRRKMGAARFLPRYALNEFINPDMPVYTLSLDVDDKELVHTFYNNPAEDGWKVRARLYQSMLRIMTDYLKLFPGIPAENELRLSAFESIPDNANHKKVGLRFLYTFSHLIFLNTAVTKRFVKGFEYFVFKHEKSVGCSIDYAVYPTTNCHQLRLTHNASNLYIPETECVMNTADDPFEMSRPLLPWCTQRSLSALSPSHSLVHMKHKYLKVSSAVVMTRLGDIQELVTKYSPKDAEFNLLRKRSNRRARRMCRKRKIEEKEEEDNEEEEPEDEPATAAVKDYSGFFNNILHTSLFPAAMNYGGGGVPPQPGRHTVYRKSSSRYAIDPLVIWCPSRRHKNPYGNQCRYFITVMPTENMFSLDAYCYGTSCGLTKGVYAGNLPPSSSS